MYQVIWMGYQLSYIFCTLGKHYLCTYYVDFLHPPAHPVDFKSIYVKSVKGGELICNNVFYK